ncbi:MAG: transcriptional regulator NrdR [Candidatus Gracilibacteria bacterium]|nr:transcriptional regulator NrdR [Candidatus Gracilibacteria bacterium]
MYCINCGHDNTRVTDSRTSEDGKAIRRRRECENCHNRFTTFEKIETADLIVEKSGNRKQRYDKDKLEDSILKAVNKRNISINSINDLIRKMEFKWGNRNEITSKEIGKDVLDALYSLDEVAYIRYASVHLNFENASDFIEFINKKKFN